MLFDPRTPRTTPVTVQTLVIMPNKGIPWQDKVRVLSANTIEQAGWIKVEQGDE